MIHNSDRLTPAISGTRAAQVWAKYRILQHPTRLEEPAIMIRRRRPELRARLLAVEFEQPDLSLAWRLRELAQLLQSFAGHRRALAVQPAEFKAWSQIILALCDELEDLRRRVAPLPELEGSKPVILYFGSDEDREEFVALVHKVGRNMRAVKL